MNILEFTGRPKSKLVQLALPFESLKAPLTFPVLVSEKLDGVYCIAHFDSDINSMRIYSRTGEEYTSMKHLIPDLNKLCNETGVDFIIFEAYTRGVPQPTISGWCRDTKGQHEELRGYIHDILTYDEYFGDEPTPYRVRYNELLRGFSNHFFQTLWVVSQTIYYTQDSIDDYAESIWNKGGEGVILRNPEAAYSVGKRNSDIVKMKKTISYDLKCVGLEEGKGKYVGKVGKLILRWRDGETIKVGSGLTDKQRSDWWSEFNYDEVVGRVVEVEAMAESTKGKLREPRFKGIRNDKVEGDF